MPLTPIKYENGLIYKICCNDPNITDCYVGSTTNIIKRRQSHKFNCNNEKSMDFNRYVYKYIRENGEWSNWSLVLIEYYSCQNKLELEKRERYYIEELKATLNKNIPTRSKKEWQEVNKEYQKEYYLNNTDKIKEQKKEYRLNNSNKIKEKNKEYKLNNADKIKEKNKEYKLINADKLKEKVFCECNCEVVKHHLARHKKTAKHQGRMLLKETI